MEKLYTKEGIADHLGVTLDQMDELIEKRMPYIELPINGNNIRFDLSLVNQWLAKRIKRAPARPTQNEKIFNSLMKSRGLDLEYELKRFQLKNTTYTPDFYCEKTNSWWEVSSTKNCFDKSLPKVLELKESHPEINIFMVKPDGTALNYITPEKNNWNNKKKVITKGK